MPIFNVFVAKVKEGFEKIVTPSQSLSEVSALKQEQLKKLAALGRVLDKLSEYKIDESFKIIETAKNLQKEEAKKVDDDSTKKNEIDTGHVTETTGKLQNIIRLVENKNLSILKEKVDKLSLKWGLKTFGEEKLKLLVNKIVNLNITDDQNLSAEIEQINKFINTIKSNAELADKLESLRLKANKLINGNVPENVKIAAEKLIVEIQAKLDWVSEGDSIDVDYINKTNTMVNGLTIVANAIKKLEILKEPQGTILQKIALELEESFRALDINQEDSNILELEKKLVVLCSDEAQNLNSQLVDLDKIINDSPFNNSTFSKLKELVGNLIKEKIEKLKAGDKTTKSDAKAMEQIIANLQKALLINERFLDIRNKLANVNNEHYKWAVTKSLDKVNELFGNLEGINQLNDTLYAMSIELTAADFAIKSAEIKKIIESDPFIDNMFENIKNQITSDPVLSIEKFIRDEKDYIKNVTKSEDIAKITKIIGELQKFKSSIGETNLSNLRKNIGELPEAQGLRKFTEELLNSVNSNPEESQSIEDRLQAIKEKIDLVEYIVGFKENAARLSAQLDTLQILVKKLPNSDDAKKLIVEIEAKLNGLKTNQSIKDDYVEKTAGRIAGLEARAKTLEQDKRSEKIKLLEQKILSISSPAKGVELDVLQGVIKRNWDKINGLIDGLNSDDIKFDTKTAEIEKLIEIIEHVNTAIAALKEMPHIRKQMNDIKSSIKVARSLLIADERNKNNITNAMNIIEKVLNTGLEIEGETNKITLSTPREGLQKCIETLNTLFGLLSNDQDKEDANCILKEVQKMTVELEKSQKTAEGMKEQYEPKGRIIPEETLESILKLKISLKSLEEDIKKYHKSRGYHFSYGGTKKKISIIERYVKETLREIDNLSLWKDNCSSDSFDGKVKKLEEKTKLIVDLNPLNFQKNTFTFFGRRPKVLRDIDECIVKLLDPKDNQGTKEKLSVLNNAISTALKNPEIQKSKKREEGVKNLQEKVEKLIKESPQEDSKNIADNRPTV